MRVDAKTRIEQDFRAHAAGPGAIEAMNDLRAGLKIAANMVVTLVPPGREQSLALTKLEEAMFHANAGIARHGVNEEL